MSDVDVVIIGSGGANLASLHYALERLGARSQVSADPGVIAAAPRLLPVSYTHLTLPTKRIV